MHKNKDERKAFQCKSWCKDNDDCLMKYWSLSNKCQTWKPWHDKVGKATTNECYYQQVS